VGLGIANLNADAARQVWQAFEKKEDMMDWLANPGAHAVLAVGVKQFRMVCET
jgi:DTW domain-containing protein YfiP